MYHRVLVIGRVAREAQTLNPTQIRFELASTTGGDEKHQDIWFTVFADGKLATAYRNLRKGQRLLIEGVLVADESGHPSVRTNREGKPFARFEIRAVAISAMGTASSYGPFPDAEAEQFEQ